MKSRIMSAAIAVSILVLGQKVETIRLPLVRPKRIVVGYARTISKPVRARKSKEIRYEYDLTDEEKTELQKIAYAEARGSGVKAMGLVMQVIMNRVKEYGSVHKVIFAPRQFEPTRNGMFAKAKITESTREALEKLMKGEYMWLKATYFIESSIYKGSWHQKALKYVCAYKSHVYCTKK